MPAVHPAAAQSQCRYSRATPPLWYSCIMCQLAFTDLPRRKKVILNLVNNFFDLTCTATDCKTCTYFLPPTPACLPALQSRDRGSGLGGGGGHCPILSSFLRRSLFPWRLEMSETERRREMGGGGGEEARKAGGSDSTYIVRTHMWQGLAGRARGRFPCNWTHVRARVCSLSLPLQWRRDQPAARRPDGQTTERERVR